MMTSVCRILYSIVVHYAAIGCHTPSGYQSVCRVPALNWRSKSSRKPKIDAKFAYITCNT